MILRDLRYISIRINPVRNAANVLHDTKRRISEEGSSTTDYDRTSTIIMLMSATEQAPHFLRHPNSWPIDLCVGVGYARFVRSEIGKCL